MVSQSSWDKLPYDGTKSLVSQLGLARSLPIARLGPALLSHLPSSVKGLGLVCDEPQVLLWGSIKSLIGEPDIIGRGWCLHVLNVLSL